MKIAVILGVMSVLAALPASAGTLFAVQQGNTLVAIDPATLAVHTVGSTGVPGEYGDLAYVESTNTMYWAPGRGNNNLYTVNLSTAAVALVGSHGVNDLFALAYDESTNKLFGQQSAGNVYEISMLDGAATLIGSNSEYPGGLDYNPATDQLILLEAGSGDFFELSRSDGTATLVNASAEPVNDCGLAWDEDQDVYWAIDYNGGLYRYDATWTRTTVLGGLAEFAALEYVPCLFADGFEDGSSDAWTATVP